MAGLGTQSAIERAELVTPRLPVRAPCFYPNKPARRTVCPPRVVDDRTLRSGTGIRGSSQRLLGRNAKLLLLLGFPFFNPAELVM